MPFNLPLSTLDYFSLSYASLLISSVIELLELNLSNSKTPKKNEATKRITNHQKILQALLRYSVELLLHHVCS